MEGGWYDDERVKLSKQRIDKTGDYFSVIVETPFIPGTTDQVDVNVSVTEKSTGNISAGLATRNQKHNLSGSIFSRIFSAVESMLIQVSTGNSTGTLGLSYTNPYFTVDGVSQV